jgi:intracellular multiplication protein IcmO
MAQYKGSSRKHEVKASRRRKDTRLFGQKFSDFFDSGDGVVLGLFILPIISLALLKMPLSGELMLLIAWMYGRSFIRTDKRSFDFPYRVPLLANVRDGSTRGGKEIGKGVTMIGNDLETKEQIYAGDSDLRTHMLVLGTTGSGKTEFLLGIVFNALVQNTGFIYVDGKGDPKLQKEIFRLSRYLGREDDLLIINFITSGRDFVEKQPDKVTNNMNIMGNTSSGMLIELIVSLMDDSGGSGDMWKGRAISFVAALTRPLIYLRDKGYINLSPEKYLEYFELNVIEELVWEHNGKYGDMFDVIVAPLRSYLVTLPGYQKTKMKKQETKTLEQHGYIVMQLTRIFNDLNFNYGHIFKTKVGDVDFFDVVINRRLLVVLLPALERAPDSLRMLGKMIVGSIKQMMAGCLGNRVEGVVREIIDSRPTNASFPFYTILDEYGYYAVIGFAVAPAQARSLGFSVIFAAQDFSSLKKSSAEEADATWENTNIRAIGRITSGQRSETWERIQGASGEGEEARTAGFERRPGVVNEAFHQQDNISIERRARLDYDDLAMQENGEFTFLIGKKERNGQTGGVRVIRGMGFYTAGPAPKEMRINDLLPVEAPEPSDLPQNRKVTEAIMNCMIDGSFPKTVRSAVMGDPILVSMHTAFERNYEDPERPRLDRLNASFAVMGWFISGNSSVTPPVEGAKLNPAESAPRTNAVAATDPDDPLGLYQAAATKALLDVADIVLSQPKGERGSAYASATPYKMAEDDDEIIISTEAVTTNVVTTNIALAEADEKAFRDKALPILQQHLFMLDDMPSDEEWEEEWEEEFSVADHDKMLEMEVMASGKAFASLEDKWDTEDRIQETRMAIARETTYIDPPVPDSIDIPEAKTKLDTLAATCAELMKKSLRDV